MDDFIQKYHEAEKRIVQVQERIVELEVELVAAKQRCEILAAENQRLRTTCSLQKASLSMLYLREAIHKQQREAND